MIKIEMDVRAAAAVRASLFRDTKDYTYDPTCCPQRVVDLRNIITEIDEQIEAQINEVKAQINEAIENETANA
jgi:hypothetical protein